MKIEDFKIDKIIKIKISCLGYRVDMVKIQWLMMEYALIVEELIKSRISRVSRNRFSKTLIKEFSLEEPWWKLKNRMHWMFYRWEKKVDK